jgi:NADPH-dependent ferric siderophore reductase
MGANSGVNGGMSDSKTGRDGVRVRRSPPPFRRVAVRRVATTTPHLVRVTLGGPDLDGFAVDQPAASVRLLVPSPGTSELVMPAWNGNEFLFDDGRRPIIRTFTPRRFDPETLELDLEIVIHEGGAVSSWAQEASPDISAAISGPGRGYAIDLSAPSFLLAGDESALPAICQLLEVLPSETPVYVHVEVAHPDARLEFPEHPRLTVTWCDRVLDASPGEALIASIRSAAIDLDTRVWAAGEAAAMHTIRRHLFEERRLPRAQATVRGYWKGGRGGSDES